MGGFLNMSIFAASFVVEKMDIVRFKVFTKMCNEGKSFKGFKAQYPCAAYLKIQPRPNPSSGSLPSGPARAAFSSLQVCTLCPNAGRTGRT
jgi:hypothetical protein